MTKKKKTKKRNFPDIDPSLFFNREISWLEFNGRVLHEARDKRTPLLERLRFVSIFFSNLDEFVMKRVGGLKRQVEAGFQSKSIDGLTPSAQLEKIGKMVRVQAENAFTAYSDICVDLKQEGVFFVEWSQCTEEEKEYLSEFFLKQIFPVLTPITVDPGHPFPFISNLSFSLAVGVRHPDENITQFSRVKIPGVTPFWIKLPVNQYGEHKFISIAQVIEHHLGYLYPGMEIVSVMPFRVTRNADWDPDDEDAADLLELIEEGLKERRFAEAVRLEYPIKGDPKLLEVLIEALELSHSDAFAIPFAVEFSSFEPIFNLDLTEQKFYPWTPLTPRIFKDEKMDIFSLLRERDVLVHHPYESFSSTVERFIVAASEDPKVLTIKMTLYRSGDRSSIIRSLIGAAEKGKQVVVLIELKARFDEERNIHWAQELERAGVHVVYGIVGLKTHTKLALVIRRDSKRGITSYAHIGTGNYHAGNAKLYTDLGLLTSNTDLTDEVIEVFNYLTGSSLKTDYKNLLVAPVNMKSKFLKLIEKEIQNKKAGKPARIIAKMNSMEDAVLSDALYRASQAGVKISLIVRGFCCLKPGVPGLSENIEVISIIGRFLEHSRIFYFANGKEAEKGLFYMGSADWMYRNLHNRVEVITPIPGIKERTEIWEILNIHLEDNRQAWELQNDGSYIQRTPKKGEGKGSHKTLMRKYLASKNPQLPY